MQRGKYSTILKDITGSMSAVEKVNFVVDILLSAYVVKTALTVLVALFIYRTLLRCVIYKKAHKKAWAPFIPIIQKCSNVENMWNEPMVVATFTSSSFRVDYIICNICCK